jgi:hypothetical protein
VRVRSPRLPAHGPILYTGRMSTRRAFVVDPRASHLRVRTRAKGMLARLAHDLELRTTALSGEASLEGDAWKGKLTVSVASLRVAGVLHGDRLDPEGLGDSDRLEVERKLREEVLDGTRDVVATLEGASRSSGEVTVALARGSAHAPVAVRVDERPDGTLTVNGRGTLSLSALGVREVKGPLGAFRVADAVEVLVELSLAPA